MFPDKTDSFGWCTFPKCLILKLPPRRVCTYFATQAAQIHARTSAMEIFSQFNRRMMTDFESYRCGDCWGPHSENSIIEGQVFTRVCRGVWGPSPELCRSREWAWGMFLTQVHTDRFTWPKGDCAPRDSWHCAQHNQLHSRSPIHSNRNVLGQKTGTVNRNQQVST